MYRLVFYHINKCAGTTLLNHFEKITLANRSIRIEDIDPTSPGRIPSSKFSAVLAAHFTHDPHCKNDWARTLGNVATVVWLRDPDSRLSSTITMISRWTDNEAQSRPFGIQLRDAARSGIEAFFSLKKLALRPLLQWHDAPIAIGEQIYIAAMGS